MSEAIERGGTALDLNATEVRAADRAARTWEAGECGPIVLGSEAHKRAFCRMLLDTHNPYRPSIVDWPALDPEARDRLVSLPIWDIAMQTEGNASLRVLSYAKAVADPLLREAIEIDGFEETRHKQVLSNLVAAYGIRLAPEPEYLPPKYPEWGFLLAGFCECVDTFFAFGLFALAKRSGFFPPELVDTFEPVVQEEGRHIIFFVNWVAWHRRNLPLWRRVLFAAKIVSVWAFLLWERIGFARGLDGDARAQPESTPQDNNFVFTGSRAIGSGNVSAAAVIDVCLSENERRFAGYDARLLRPRLMPRLM
ncbi:MAG TPA: ferritin-like domain-containing protein, partial [Stellaceae bacterium]|nr:ferritin-like domain-containing protein [Stellaceae bacterium]